MPLAVGQVFAGYTIVRVLGAGAMGSVYLAQHPRLPRHDAIKVLSAELTADPQYRTRFVREADIAAGLSHPSVVGVHDRGEYQGQFWISMDYVQGTDAARLLREQFPGGMPVDEALQIVTAVGSALDYAHQRGLLHRDVKPSNILLADPDSQWQRIFLADFGIARRVDDTAGLTATNMAVGTVAYAAPEQLMGEPVDGRADQYALACTAFHLLAGAPPYANSSAAVVITKHVMGPVPSISHRRPELAGLDPVFAKAMAKAPIDRFGSCQELARELNSGLSAAPATVQYFHDTQVAPTRAAFAPERPPAPSGPLPVPAAGPAKKRLWRPKVLIPALVAVALLVGGGTFAAVKVSQRPGGKPAAAAQPNTGPFTGTYTVDLASTTDLFGNPSDQPPKKETWAVRSVCRPTGCVATASRRSGDFTLQPTMVLDDVGGRWLSVGVGSGKCHDAPAEFFEVFVLQPRPDGALAGFYTSTSSNGCGGKRAVTFARTGDADVASLPDPAGTPPRVVSPAEALRGRYHESKKYSNPTAREAEYDWTVRTDCLRTAVKCMSYFYRSGAARPLVFGSGHWIWARDYSDKCPNGEPMTTRGSAQFPLPQPPQDPIPVLTGHGHREDSAPCALNLDFDDLFERIGD